MEVNKQLPDIETSDQFLRAKGRDIDLEFLSAPSVTSDGSKVANFEFHHLYTRRPAHECHYRNCTQTGFHISRTL
jgi:hypothetical protein